MIKRITICSCVGSFSGTIPNKIQSICQIDGNLHGDDFAAYAIKMALKPDDSDMLEDSWVVVKATQKVGEDGTLEANYEKMLWVSAKTNEQMLPKWRKENADNPSSYAGRSHSNVLYVYTNSNTSWYISELSVTLGSTTINLISGNVYNPGGTDLLAQAIVDSINNSTERHGFSAIKRVWLGAYSIVAPLESGPKYNTLPINVVEGAPGGGINLTSIGKPNMLFTPTKYQTPIKGYKTKDEAISAYANHLCGWTHLGKGIDDYFQFGLGMP